ncbi:MAG: hypothetical protein ACOCRX_00695 [Candidatus Woesearchaeota archaeon]
MSINTRDMRKVVNAVMDRLKEGECDHLIGQVVVKLREKGMFDGSYNDVELVADTLICFFRSSIIKLKDPVLEITRQIEDEHLTQSHNKELYDWEDDFEIPF